MIVGQTLAYTRKRAGEVDLSGAGRWAKGDFLTARDGHLLRWEKQLVTRGAVRDFDAHGVCGHGVVYKATDGQRLKHHQRLYPGSPAPLPVVDTSVPRRGRAGLVQLLLRHGGEELGAELIEDRTGIKPKHLGREVRTEPVMQAMDLAHWMFVLGTSRWQKASFRRKEAEDYGLDAAD